MGVRKGPKWAFAKVSDKPDVSSLIPINLFNVCNETLFAGMTLTQRTTQVHCSGVIH